jgi:hypothetical protein
MSHDPNIPVLVHPRAPGQNPGSSEKSKMTRPAVRDAMYRGRVFDTGVIELCVRWYITYRLSYRDLVAMMAERGVEVAHTRYWWHAHLKPCPCAGQNFCSTLSRMR